MKLELFKLPPLLSLNLLYPGSLPLNSGEDISFLFSNTDLSTFILDSTLFLFTCSMRYCILQTNFSHFLRAGSYEVVYWSWWPILCLFSVW